MSKFLISLLLALCTLPVAAHTVWLERSAAVQGQFLVHFGGHAGKLDAYLPERVSAVVALDDASQPLAIERVDSADQVRLRVPRTCVLIGLHYDNGIYSRTGSGPSVPKPMNEVEGAISATRPLKYHKTLLRFGAAALTEALGQPFEIVPLNAAMPVAGEPWHFRVLLEGQPAAGIKYGRGEDTGEGMTNDDGTGSFVPQAGFNKLWAGIRLQVKDNPAYTELSYEYLLSFELP